MLHIVESLIRAFLLLSVRLSSRCTKMIRPDLERCRPFRTPHYRNLGLLWATLYNSSLTFGTSPTGEFRKICWFRLEYGILWASAFCTLNFLPVFNSFVLRFIFLCFWCIFSCLFWVVSTRASNLIPVHALSANMPITQDSCVEYTRGMLAWWAITRSLINIHISGCKLCRKEHISILHAAIASCDRCRLWSADCIRYFCIDRRRPDSDAGAADAADKLPGIS